MIIANAIGIGATQKTPEGILKEGLVGQYDFLQGVDPEKLYDISGNNNHFQIGSTSGVDTNDPLWTERGMTFTGAEQDYNILSPLPNMFKIPYYTIFVAAKNSGTGGELITFDDKIVMRFVRTDRVDAILNNGSNYVSTSLTQDVTNPILVVSRKNTENLSLYAKQWSILANTTGANFSGASNVYIGRNSGTNTGLNLNGEIYYIAIYNRALTNEEIFKVEAYIRTILSKRGVTI